MKSAIHHMSTLRYYKNRRPWTKTKVVAPTFEQVEHAIRRMDNYCFPIVELFLTKEEEDVETFLIIGGNGPYALAELFGRWAYENPDGSDAEVTLWDSDQGYECMEKNLIYDVEDVLKIVKRFYETGSYDDLYAVLST